MVRTNVKRECREWHGDLAARAIGLREPEAGPISRCGGCGVSACFLIYLGDNVTGTSVTLSTGSALSAAALRTAASLGPS